MIRDVQTKSPRQSGNGVYGRVSGWDSPRLRNAPTGSFRRGRLGDVPVSATIISAVDANTGEPLDPGSFGIYDAGSGGVTDSQASAPTGTGPFSSAAAYASGTGWGPLNLPSPFPSIANPLGQYAGTLLIVAAVIGAVWLWSRNQ